MILRRRKGKLLVRMMRYGSGYKAEIEIRDLLFHLLRRWRSILLLSVLFYLLWGNHEIFCITLYAAGSGGEGKKAAGDAGEQIVPAVAQVKQEALEKQEIPKSDQIQGETVRTEKENTPERKKTVKCYTMNFAAWVCLAVTARGVFYVLGGRLRGARELRRQYGYRLLGIVPAPEKRRFLSCVDRMVKRLEAGGRGLAEEAFAVAAVNIRNMAGRGRRILLTGTLESRRLEALAEKISSGLTDVAVTVGEKMASDPATVRKLADCEGVILVEQKDRSRRAEIQREQDMIAVMGKDVVGYIFVR